MDRDGVHESSGVLDLEAPLKHAHDFIPVNANEFELTILVNLDAGGPKDNCSLQDDHAEISCLYKPLRTIVSKGDGQRFQIDVPLNHYVSWGCVVENPKSISANLLSLTAKLMQNNL